MDGAPPSPSTAGSDAKIPPLWAKPIIFNWRNEELKKLKRQCKQAEQKWRKDKTAINHQSFSNHQKNTTQHKKCQKQLLFQINNQPQKQAQISIL